MMAQTPRYMTSFSIIWKGSDNRPDRYAFYDNHPAALLRHGTA